MTDDGHHHRVIADLREPTRGLRRAIPDTWDGFAALHRAAMHDGALSTAVKETLALAIATVQRCDGCIAYHARAAARAGATREQVVEALGVAVLMTGGPGSVYAPRGFAAFLEFEDGPQVPTAASRSPRETAAVAP